MTWDLEEAGDDAVTLHREDGLVLSATRVADDAGAANRTHRWTEWRFAVTDGDGNQLTEHGWEIVDEEHLWEVLDGFTHRFRRDVEEERSAAEEETTPPESEGETRPTSEETATVDESAEDGRASAPDSADASATDSADEGTGSGDNLPSPSDSGSVEPSTADAASSNGITDPAAVENADSHDPPREDADGDDGKAADDDPVPPTRTAVASEPGDVADEPLGAERPAGESESAEVAVTATQPEPASDAPTERGSTAAADRSLDGADDPEVTYRPARPSDAAELAAVYRSAYAENRELGFPAKAESATADDVREWIEAHGLLVAVADGDVVGGVRLEETDPARVKLSRLAVHDDWKGKGIGTELLDRAEAAVNAGNGETVWLTTPEDHPFLSDLYRDRGYERTGEYPLEYRDYDEIVMEKHLG